MSDTGNRSLDAWEHWRTPRLIRFAVTIFWYVLLNFAAWRCYPCNLRRNHQEKRRWVAKTNASKLLVCWLRFHFQKLLCKCSWSRDNYDLKSKSKITAMIMKWLSQGIPLICGNVGTYKHFWILAEQISVGIFQIMIQARDLVQILYRGLPAGK